MPRGRKRREREEPSARVPLPQGHEGSTSLPHATVSSRSRGSSCSFRLARTCFSILEPTSRTDAGLSRYRISHWRRPCVAPERLGAPERALAHAQPSRRDDTGLGRSGFGAQESQWARTRIDDGFFFGGELEHHGAAARRGEERQQQARKSERLALGPRAARGACSRPARASPLDRFLHRAQNVFGANPIGLGAVTEDESVAKRRDDQRANVVDVGRRFATQRRPPLRGEDQSLAPPRPGAESHVIAHLAHALGAGTGRPRQAHREIHRFVGHRNAGHQRAQGPHVIDVKHRFADLRGARGRAARDFDFVVFGRVVDVDLEKKSIELRLGQRIGPLLLDGVARREHLERIGQRVGRRRLP